MWIYYVLLFAAALIFSLQFLVTKLYQRYKGSSLLATVRLTLWAHLTIAIIFIAKSSFAKGGLAIDFTWFTFAITFGMALVAFACVFIGVKVLAVGSMGVYSMFMMLGSLILPTLVGFLYGETICDRKIIGIVLTLIALLLSLETTQRGKLSWKVVLYYVGTFFCNGMVGVFLTLHQKNPAWTAGVVLKDGAYIIDSDAYMIWYGLSAVILCTVILSVMKAKNYCDRKKGTARPLEAMELKRVDAKALKVLVAFIPLIYGICSGLGDYFIALATAPKALGSSVTFPIINGGTIIFSNVIGSTCLKEKIELRRVLSMSIVICATVLFMFATI